MGEGMSKEEKEDEMKKMLTEIIIREKWTEEDMIQCNDHCREIINFISRDGKDLEEILHPRQNP